MTNRTDLKPWAIFRTCPDMKNVCVARCRNRSDAESLMSILRGLYPRGTKLEIVFDQRPAEVKG